MNTKELKLGFMAIILWGLLYIASLETTRMRISYDLPSFLETITTVVTYALPALLLSRYGRLWFSLYGVLVGAFGSAVWLIHANFPNIGMFQGIAVLQNIIVSVIGAYIGRYFQISSNTALKRDRANRAAP